jgi:hypothetical protein
VLGGGGGGWRTTLELFDSVGSMLKREQSWEGRKRASARAKKAGE